MHTTLRVLQPKIKTNPSFQHINRPYWISEKLGGREGRGGEGSYKRGWVNNFLPLRRGGGGGGAGLIAGNSQELMTGEAIRVHADHEKKARKGINGKQSIP